MFCANCGTNIEVSNEEFCPNCGSKLPVSPQPRPQSTPTYTPTYNPVNYQTVSDKGSAGPYSKKCLAFAILSLVMGGVGTMVGTFAGLGSALSGLMGSYGPFSGLGGGGIALTLIVPLILSGIGIVFGILGRVMGNKADAQEPKNTLVKIGSILSIIGIITNIMSMVTIPLTSGLGNLTSGLGGYY